MLDDCMLFVEKLDRYLTFQSKFGIIVTDNPKAFHLLTFYSKKCW